MPTPPVAACTRMMGAAGAPTTPQSACTSMMCAVMQMVGAQAAVSYRTAEGLVDTSGATVAQRVPRAPGATPNTLLPTSTRLTSAASTGGACTTTPAQSAPGGPGSPGYIPSTLSTSRKLMPTACTSSTTLRWVPRAYMPVWWIAVATRPVSEPRGLGESCTGCMLTGHRLSLSMAM